MSALINENWARWVFATMSGDFVNAMAADTDVDFELFIEGTHKGLPTETELLEFRMDGPQTRQPSRGCFVLEFEINILVRSYMDDVDFHKMRRSCGKVATFLQKNHCIYRYGDGPDDDDESLLGTLQLKNRRSDEHVRINNFGQIDANVRIEEATVEALFEIHLTEGD
jgi:hypothetical protein